jgi:hypothetical protein
VKLRRQPLYLKLLFVVTGVSFACDVLSRFILDNNYVGNTYRLAEFILLLYIFYLAFNQRRWSKMFILIGLSYVFFFLLNLLFIQQEKMNSYTNILSALIFITVSIVFFYRLIQDLPTEKIHRLPMFWIAIAVLVYFAGNLFLFALTHYLVNTFNNRLALYWGFHNFLLIVKNMLFATALWQNLRTPKLQ